MRADAKKLIDREVAADRLRTWHDIRRLITPQEDHAAVREGQEGLEIEITEGMTGDMLASESEADDPEDKDIAELDIAALPSEGSNSEAEENDGMEFVADDGRIIDIAIGVPAGEVAEVRGLPGAAAAAVPLDNAAIAEEEFDTQELTRNKFVECYRTMQATAQQFGEAVVPMWHH